MWRLAGDIESNQIDVSQNAADVNSPLDCVPACPQEDYVYDYHYADTSNDDTAHDYSKTEYQNARSNYKEIHPQDSSILLQHDEVSGDKVLVCPGGGLTTCVNVCPGQFGEKL